MKKKILFGLIIGIGFYIGVANTSISADSIGTFDFESPTYSTGNIDGQDNWSKTGAYESEIVLTSSFPNAAGFGFGDQSLRVSNAITSGSFGDQTISPSLSNPSHESSATNYYEATFEIGSTLSTEQTGLFISVSPDDGLGSRMSYVGFEDLADGIHVIFYDVSNPGPLNTVSSFNPTDTITIDRTSSHKIKIEMELITGPANDVVRLYVDDVLVHTGTSWEDYYRYDPEQNGNGNVLPSVSNLIIPIRGNSVPENSGNGYLIDNVSLYSGEIPVDPYAIPEECSEIEGLGDPIIGTDKSEKIIGTDGNDLIFALGGSDKVLGKKGHDCIVGGDGHDTLYGQDGNDVILGGEGSDSLRGNDGKDYLYGGPGSDSLKGGNGNDFLYGGDNSDSLKGDNGNDLLDGEEGSDTAKGGQGIDTCTAESVKQCE